MRLTWKSLFATVTALMTVGGLVWSVAALAAEKADAKLVNDLQVRAAAAEERVEGLRDSLEEIKQELREQRRVLEQIRDRIR